MELNIRQNSKKIVRGLLKAMLAVIFGKKIAYTYKLKNKKTPHLISYGGNSKNLIFTIHQ